MFQVQICPYNILLLFFADIVRLKKCQLWASLVTMQKDRHVVRAAVYVSHI